MMLDGGADRHMIRDIRRLTDVKQLPNSIAVTTADISQEPMIATHSGTLNIEVESHFNEWTLVTLNDVLFVLNIVCDIISGELIVASRVYRMDYCADYSDVIEIDSNVIIGSALMYDKAKYFNVPQAAMIGDLPVAQVQLFTVTTELARKQSVILWHRRFGHPSAKVMRQLSTHLLVFPHDLIIGDADLADCDICLRAKSRKLPHDTQCLGNIQLLERVWTDIMGPITPSSREEWYVIIFLDDYSNFAVGFIIKKRSEAAKCFNIFDDSASVQFPELRISNLVCDGAKEFTLDEMRRLCENIGITIESRQPYCPELQGCIEKFNGTVSLHVRCMILDLQVPTQFSPEAVLAAINIINRLPTKSNLGSGPPYELWHTRKATAKYACPFGCIAYAHIPVADSKKFDERANKVINFGASGSAGYNLYNPTTNSFFTSRDIKFLEYLNFCDYEWECEIEAHNALLHHDYANALTSTSTSLKLDDIVPATYSLFF